MKRIIQFFACLLLMGGSLTAQETVITGRDAILTRQKTTCGTIEEGKTRFGMWEGRAYSRVPGEKDRHLFNVIGINTRQCSVKEDDTRGRGFRSVSREVMFYLDPETNEIMDVWTNPWSGQEVPVVHVANDPVNMRAYSYEKDESGKSTARVAMRKYGDVMVSSAEIPLFYSNPLGSEFQAYIGGAYHAMEIFNTYYKAAEIENSKIAALTQSNISWSRVAQWLPWMQMGDRAGIMVFNATGFSTFDEEEIWPALKAAIQERYPAYMTPPPLDDPRPNETSWTVFKTFMKDKEKAKVGGR
ncbi:MAG: DUF1838 family protein [Saprospiraceae bacterium]|nr:DUF1838 family protein [Saprospiraceae bacterium]